MQLSLADGTIHSVGVREKHDFAWLESRFMRIFCVFDQQDSGNISFGCLSSQLGRVFIKYAGAHPSQYVGHPSDAIVRLRQAVTTYQDIQPHEHLLPLQMAFDVNETHGYVLIFPWFDQGECLHSHWIYPPPAKYEHPRSPYYRFRRLSIEKRLKALEAIFSFHEHVDQLNYIAIDFYDGSILYNFETDTLKLCDIDLYEKMPCRPSQPPWGSPRYLSPEEFDGAVLLDHRTNVFRMGACAFGLLGGETDRSRAKWEAIDRLHEVACRAVSHHPKDRHENVGEFLRDWHRALETLKEGNI